MTLANNLQVYSFIFFDNGQLKHCNLVFGHKLESHRSAYRMGILFFAQLDILHDLHDPKLVLG